MKWARQAFGIVGTGRMKFLYNRRMEKKRGAGAAISEFYNTSR